MKKPDQHRIDLQKKYNFSGKYFSRLVVDKKSWSALHQPLPQNFSLENERSRQKLLNLIKIIKEHKSQDSFVYLDFSQVKILFPMATIHFVQNVERYAHVKIRGRASGSPIVRGMLTKLSIHRRMNLQPCINSHELIERWYTFSGEKTEFGEGYDEIEDVLREKFGDTETFDALNTAIGEAVNNVVEHAYETNAKYKKWKIFLTINKEHCYVVISDLGLTIPHTVPTKVSEDILMRLTSIATWKGINDGQRIRLASSYRKSITELSHRGKGFSDMKAVCDQISNAKMIVHSRNGRWVNIPHEKDQISTFSEEVNGTIITWILPLNNMNVENNEQMA